jgi:hypothetical protein
MIFVSEIVEKHIGLDFGNCQGTLEGKGRAECMMVLIS